ncbi:hypothetical protein, conserved [Leishmania tarentolae]|uniref:IQ calmodulin-binding motif family protein n=1 Tax=Leishmania tarentolae TaxID=5689 RepID=A0A640KVD9_LEITA|nr:hypothetical protein, conserved [Leishmania tarentolae]
MERDTNFIYQYPTREGHSWPERDALFHHYSPITPAYGCSLVRAVLSALENAAAEAPLEIEATVKIQATFRMYQQRKAFLRLRHHACLIQRVYRGYATRRRLEVERTTVRQMVYLKAVFDIFATRIQSYYRGYLSRKTRSNYYAQKAYLKVVTARSSEVLVQALTTHKEQDDLRNEEAQRVHDLSYAHRMAHMHYMVSTCSVPSVYQRSGTPSIAKQAAQSTSHTCREEDGRSEEGALVNLVASTVMPAGEGSDGGGADDEMLRVQAAAYASGEKIENDIRYHARAARRNRSTLKSEESHRSRAQTVSATASSQPPGKTIADAPVAEGATVSATSPVAGIRLPALTPSQPAQRSHPLNSIAPAATVTVPWEVASAHPPKRPLVPRAPPLTGQSFSQTAPPALSRTTRTGRKPRKAQQASEDDNFHAAETPAAQTAGPGPSAGSINSSMSRAAVSSFHPRFAVKRHDCIEHQLSIINGVVSDGNDSHSLTSPLLSMKEISAVQRSVDHKVMEALHGDAIFKVPARLGGQ